MHIDDHVIFIHNPRAAGTSVRRALCDGLPPNMHLPIEAQRLGPGYTNQKHLFARMLRKRMSEHDWNRRAKFGIVRNPFDRLVSLYGLFRRPTEKAVQKRSSELTRLHVPHKMNKFARHLIHPTLHGDMPKEQQKELYEKAFGYDFKPWLLEFCEEYSWNGCRYLDPKRPMTRIQQVEWFEGLDIVFRFEQLDELRDWLVDLGYPVPVPENATKHTPWQSYYDNETFDWVLDVFKDDILRFGY